VQAVSTFMIWREVLLVLGVLETGTKRTVEIAESLNKGWPKSDRDSHV